MDENAKYYAEIIVKFREGGRLFEEDNKLMADHLSLDSFNNLVNRFETATARRSFPCDPVILRRLVANAREWLDAPIPNLDLFARIRFTERTNEIEAILEQLNRDEEIEMAQLAALPGWPPSADLMTQQSYLNTTFQGGVDAHFAWAIDGGDGTHVTVVDCEFGFNPTHEDLPVIDVIFDGDNDLTQRQNHGTAVLGILGGINDAQGVSGICHGATLQFASESGGHRTDCFSALLNRVGTKQLVAGDVVLLEMQTSINLPAEYDHDLRAAILTLVGNGICVVAAAGNGDKNLDDYSFWNPSSPPVLIDSSDSILVNDSGAILVGAGASSLTAMAQSRNGISNYGARITCQGWGDSVTTSGGNGNIQSGLNERYTASFRRTSSAAAIIAGVVACLQSAAIANLGSPLSPLAVRALLADPNLGIPQVPHINVGSASDKPIGALPDMQRLFEAAGIV